MEVLPWTVLTCALIEGVSSQSECDAALVAGEAAAMEELALGADTLQHVDPLTAEVTLRAVCHRHAITGTRTGTGTGLRLWLWHGCRRWAELGGHRRLRRLRGER